jgi:hypothetical protein
MEHILTNFSNLPADNFKSILFLKLQEFTDYANEKLSNTKHYPFKLSINIPYDTFLDSMYGLLDYLEDDYSDSMDFKIYLLSKRTICLCNELKKLL